MGDGTNPRLRRPTQEMAALPYQVEALQDHAREQRSFNAQLLNGLAQINLTLLSLDARLKVHDENRVDYRRVIIGIAIGVGIAVFAAVGTMIHNRL